MSKRGIGSSLFEGTKKNHDNHRIVLYESGTYVTAVLTGWINISVELLQATGP